MSRTRSAARTLTPVLASIACLTGVLASSASAAPTAPTAPTSSAQALAAVPLPTLAGGNGFAAAVNDAGVVVGSADLASGDFRAVVWRDGVISVLPTLGGHQSQANDIGEDGRIVGMALDRSGHARSVEWVNGRIRVLGVDAVEGSTASDVSRAGVVGTRWLPGFFEGRRAYRLTTAGALRTLSVPPGASAEAINDAGMVAGTSGWKNPGDPAFENYQAFTWQRGVTTRLGTLGGPGSTPSDLNNLGHVVGTTTTGTGRSVSFFWDGARMRPLPSGSYSFPSAQAINERDVTVGTDGAANTAVRWAGPTSAPVPLPRPAGSAGTQASDVNTNGAVVGQYFVSTDAGFQSRPVLWR